MKIQTWKPIQILVLAAVLVISFTPAAKAEVIEKIYATVNGELITFSELKDSEARVIQMLQQQYQGEELEKKIAEMKAALLDQLIEQKVILSAARAKNYDMANDMDMIIKDVKKQYNLNTDDELKQALASQGLDYDQWLLVLKENRMSQRLIFQEIGSQIKIDNAALIDYYKKNPQEFTKPEDFSLNCIYLAKEQFVTDSMLAERKKAIDSELTDANFIDIAKKYSQLPATEGEDGISRNYFLGKFKKGELDSTIEEAGLKLEKEGAVSPWTETETGWYRLQLVSRTPKVLMEFKTVKAQIERKLFEAERNIKVEEFVKQLKKDSYIKIIEEYKGK